jgi:hypothetical protein
MFAPQLAGIRGARLERMVRLLAAVLDVTVWKQLRRDDGLSVRSTRDRLERLVTAVLSTG